MSRSGHSVSTAVAPGPGRIQCAVGGASHVRSRTDTKSCRGDMRARGRRETTKGDSQVAPIIEVRRCKPLQIGAIWSEPRNATARVAKVCVTRAVTLAERAGFEPAVQVYPVHRFSKPAHSTTLPPLQIVSNSRQQPSLAACSLSGFCPRSCAAASRLGLVGQWA